MDLFFCIVFHRILSERRAANAAKISAFIQQTSEPQTFVNAITNASLSKHLLIPIKRFLIHTLNIPNRARKPAFSLRTNKFKGYPIWHISPYQKECSMEVIMSWTSGVWLQFKTKFAICVEEDNGSKAWTNHWTRCLFKSCGHKQCTHIYLCRNANGSNSTK